MTRNEILRMARECRHWTGQTVEMNDVGLERFAALVAAAEREECAKVCVANELIDWPTAVEIAAVRKCATAIRARSNT